MTMKHIINASLITLIYVLAFLLSLSLSGLPTDDPTTDFWHGLLTGAAGLYMFLMLRAEWRRPDTCAPPAPTQRVTQRNIPLGSASAIARCVASSVAVR